jgi:FkbM family methyltransferase
MAWMPRLPSDLQVLADDLRALPPKKQTALLQLWHGVELEQDGLTLNARSRKELRRFVRPKDPAMAAWIASFEPGDVFYDIGANCGSLTLAAGSMHGSDIKIVAVEPSYSSFESLVRNLSLNKMLGFTIPLQMALLDRTGLQPMYYASTEAGTSTHAVGEAVDFNGRAFTPVEVQEMPTYAVDDLIEMLGLPLPTRVKIDVDGFEEGVVRGATRTLAQGSIRDLAIEISDPDRQGTRGRAIQGVLAEHGYEPVETFLHHDSDTAPVPGEVTDLLFRRRAA